MAPKHSARPIAGAQDKFASLDALEALARAFTAAADSFAATIREAASEAIGEIDKRRAALADASDSDLLTVPEAAELVRRDQQTIRNWCKNGLGEFNGERWLIRRDRLEQEMQRRFGRLRK